MRSAINIGTEPPLPNTSGVSKKLSQFSPPPPAPAAAFIAGVDAAVAAAGAVLIMLLSHAVMWRPVMAFGGCSEC